MTKIEKTKRDSCEQQYIKYIFRSTSLQKLTISDIMAQL